MAFDCNNNLRKPLLFSDLFKSHGNTAAPETSKLEGSSCSSTSTQFLSSYDSSSSGFSTPLYSDLGSSESEDGDFISELTRQMAECMLQEDESSVVDSVSEVSSPVNNNSDKNHAHSGAFNDLVNGLCSSSVCLDDQMPPKIKEKNKPPVSIKGSVCRGRRVKGTESAQQKRMKKTEQQYKEHRGRINGFSGSGMKAVFLGRTGPRIGPPGTGVFLPRDPSELKIKSGCSTVLIPTRVLQVLEELHLSKLQDSTARPSSGAGSTSPKGGSMASNVIRNMNSELETRPANADRDEMQLPQEWTY